MWTLYADGGCKPNPGKGAYSAVLFLDSKIVESVGGFLHDTTNNRAEYTACLAGLSLISKHCPREHVKIFLDSQLVLKQISGEWKINDNVLKELQASCISLINSLDVSFHWVKGHSGSTGNDYVDSTCSYFIAKSNVIV